MADGTKGRIQESKCKNGILRLFHSPSDYSYQKLMTAEILNSPWNVLENSAIVRTFLGVNWSGIVLEENALVQEMFPVF